MVHLFQRATEGVIQVTHQRLLRRVGHGLGQVGGSQESEGDGPQELHRLLLFIHTPPTALDFADPALRLAGLGRQVGDRGRLTRARSVQAGKQGKEETEANQATHARTPSVSQ